MAHKDFTYIQTVEDDGKQKTVLFHRESGRLYLHETAAPRC